MLNTTIASTFLFFAGIFLFYFTHLLDSAGGLISYGMAVGLILGLQLGMEEFNRKQVNV